jgi:hypothetical protein
MSEDLIGTPEEDEVDSLRARVAELEDNIKRLTKFRLSPALHATLELLLEQRLVDADIIVDRTGTTRDIKVTIHRLRRELAAFNIDVKTSRRVSYWLDDADKERIRELLATDEVETASAA